jgi:uncharacterized protein (TIGR03083 family)
MATSPWPTIHAERAALVDDLKTLTDEQWKTPSLADGWSVEDALAHMIAPTEMNPPVFIGRLIRSGFKFNTMQDKLIAKATAGGPAATLAHFERQVGSTTHPPGPADTWLGETIVHAEDIRRPLGIKRDYPEAALVRLADLYRKSNTLIGGKRRASGLTLRATDCDYVAGDGPEVSGPLLSIVMAITGRHQVLDDLSGDGVAVLRDRM